MSVRILRLAVLTLAPALLAAAPAVKTEPGIPVTGHCVIRGTTIGLDYQGQLEAESTPKSGSRRIAVLFPGKEEIAKQLATNGASMLQDDARYGAGPLAAPSDVTMVTVEEVAPGKWSAFGYGNLNSKDDPDQEVDVQMTCDLATTSH